MKRTADYTIEGFLYQFNKTLFEILTSDGEATIMVEGIIEDIDISSLDGICAIQCKYHESQQNFSLSAIYKPILEMMRHFVNLPESCVNYHLYAYFPNQSGEYKPSKTELETILKSKSKELQSAIKEVEKIDLDLFRERLTIEFGKSFVELEKDVNAALVKVGLPENEIETLIYPNAINEIANLSKKHDSESRVITRTALVEVLKKIRKTAITRWTLSLNSYKKILEAKRKQLKPNLSKNTRLRYFLISKNAIDSFTDEIVNFIQEYLEKYHFKESHISTPLFCLDCSPEEFDDIRVRIYKKGINFSDGFIVAKFFDEKHFFRQPIVSKQKGVEPQVEFRLRILRHDEESDNILWEKSCDDMFVISEKAFSDIAAKDIKDVNIEHLGVSSFRELKYVLGMSDTYE